MKKENSDELLDEFYLAYRNRKYNEAILSLKDIIQEERKGSFWLYSTLSSCYYELKDYKKALFYAKKAYKLKPNSPSLAHACRVWEMNKIIASPAEMSGFAVTWRTPFLS